MPEPLRPTKASTYRRENILWVPEGGLAVPSAPKVAELTAASVIDLSNILFDDGAPAPSQSTERAREKRRYGDQGTGEILGATEYSGGDLMMAMDPQAAEGTPARKAWETFINGARGFFVNRLNVPIAAVIVAAQRVTVWPSEVGPALEGKAGEGAGAQAAFSCTYAVDVPFRNVPVLSA